MIKTTPSVASFLLPYMVLNVVQRGDETAREEIRAEIIAVLKTTAALYTPRRTPLSYPSQNIVSTSTSRIASSNTHHSTTTNNNNNNTNNNQNNNKTSSSGGGGGAMNVQRVFALYDWLRQWLVRMKEAGRGGRATARVERATSMAPVETLLDSIPHQLLARGAALAHAWPRALLHIESHIRQQLDKATVINHFTSTK